MARKQKKNDVHGWVVLDKPFGMTSTQAVGAVKRLVGTSKAGHAGTLDPLASGMLPIALGEATKTVPFVMDGEKVYRFTVRWGAETTTDDAEGEVVATAESRPTADEINTILDDFEGVIMQVPPAFSAIKVDGERAYDLARAGEEVELAARPIEIHALDLVECPDADTAVFEAECGKGTYVRALARDMGRQLGCRGHVVELRRLVVGPFDEDDMISLEMLEALRHSPAREDDLAKLIRPIETALDDIPALALSEADANRLKNGQPVLLRGRDAPTFEGPAYAACRGQLVALGDIERGEFHPKRVFNLTRS
ncbi:tRNA pseudouridine synthase B [Hartmannibacter diazotrophicus]|uniref:tRNA pseudouridine synthase B n=1 Tax=Hartmannibacter diazotrophicus TaxID=1482074 RepID=A0A2C9DDP0_9HYPH|nr:tRNA pseudouridine(55) synthase TruB [Hartmannibacter diazotrophicus]SON58218.1 tRNA pseudouridine synthase B [Hartmannibacter diazotrophicus]